jgi:outer membrane lipoprotein-sorting protein
MFRRLLFAAVLAPALCCVVASAQSVDDVINKHIEARGGIDKIRALKALKMTGTAMIGPGLEAPFTMHVKRPGSMHMELAIQGKALIQATDGATPWMINPFTGNSDPQALSAEDAKDVEQQADFDGPLIDHKAKGHTIELLGKEDFEGTDVYKLKLTLKGGDVQYVFLDATSYLQLKETTKRVRDGKESEFESLTSNYKVVEGVQFPFSLETKANGQPQFSLTLTSIEANKAVDDAIFKLPAKK